MYPETLLLLTVMRESLVYLETLLLLTVTRESFMYLETLLLLTVTRESPALRPANSAGLPEITELQKDRQ